MKNTIMLSLVSLSLLSLVACGKSVEKVIKNAGEDMSKQVECSVAETAGQIETSFAQDYDVKLYKSTVQKVLADIRVVKYLDPKDFWSFLTDDTRNILNYELNIHLIKNKTSSPATVYQATAYFFTAVRDLFQDGTDYKLRDMDRTLFSFSLRGIKSNRMVMVNSKCGKYQKTDLATITIDDVILKADSVNDVFECRTKDKSLVLMDGRDLLFLSTGKSILQLRTQGYKKDINNRIVKLEYQSRDVSIDIKINKKKDEILGNWPGKKASVEAKSTDLAIDDLGVCTSMKNSF